MQLEWFVYHKNSVLGPFSTNEVHSQLSAGKFSEESFIWWKGEKDWVSIAKWQTDYPAIIKRLEAHFNVQWKVKAGEQVSDYMDFDECIQFLKAVELNNTLFICKKTTNLQEEWESIFSNSVFLNALEMTRRKHPRVPIVATAKVSKSDSKFSYLVKVNILGQGGIGVAGLGKNFPTGTSVDIRLESPSLAQPVHAEGRVVYHTKDGVTGIEFETINAESQGAIIEYINQFQQTRNRNHDKKAA